MPPQSIVLNPNQTLSNSTWTVTGTGSSLIAVSDNSDASYIQQTAEDFATATFAVEGIAFTSDVRILSVTPTLRYSLSAANADLTLGIGTSSGPLPNDGFPAASLTTQNGSPQTVAPGGSRWTPSDIDDLQIRVGLADFGGGPLDARVMKLTATFTYDDQPAVTVTSPPDDDTTTAGNQVTTASAPSAGWTFSDPNGLAQERWEVRRYLQPTAGWGGFDPDTTSETPVETRTGFGTGLSTSMSTVLANGATYRDYVKAAGTTPSGYAVLWSEWAYREFTMALVPPPNPTIVATPDSALNRVAIALTAGAGSPTTDYFTVERSDDGGTTWTEIRVSPVANTGGTVTVYDYEAPRSADGTDADLVYRVRATDTGTGGSISSAAVSSSVVNLASDGLTWIKSTSDPSLNRAFDITPDGSDPASIGSESEEPQAVYYAQGARYPTVHSATIRAERWPTLLVQLDDDTEKAAFEALRALQEPLLWQTCNGDDGLEQHYVRLGGVRLWRRVVEAGQNTAQQALYSLTATEVEMPPTGGAVSYEQQGYGSGYYGLGAYG